MTYNNLRPKNYTPTDSITEDATSSRRMLTISFDDGYDSDYNVVFPIFKELGVRGTFFVIGNEANYSDPKYATASQLKEMAQQGQEIACHSHTHPPYFNEPDNSVIYNDMVLSKKTIENAIGRQVLTHAYPYGGSDDAISPTTVADAVRVKGIAAGIYESARGTGKFTKSSPYPSPYVRLTLYGEGDLHNVACTLLDGNFQRGIDLINHLAYTSEPYWLNIAYHRVYPDGATDKPDTRLFSSQLKEIVQHAVNFRDQGMIDIVPFYEGARRIKTAKSQHLPTTIIT